MSSPQRGIPFVVAAPSGTGKTTVCRRVIESDPGVVFSVSHTTRPKRAGEVDGADYHFTTPAEFDALVAEDAFLEWAEYNGNRYGTSWASLDALLAEGRDVILEIEVQGARQVRERCKDARLIFLLPPSLASLGARLRGRGTDPDEQIRDRLELAPLELERVHDFDFVVVNDDLSQCVATVEKVIRSERAGGSLELRERLGSEAALARFHAAGDSA